MSDQVAVVNSPLIRKRGRPPGSGKRPAEMRNWEPKTWTSLHQAVVLRFCSGATQKEIAEQYELSEVHVNNIVNCKQGQALIQQVKDELLRKGNPAEKLAYLQNKTVERMVDFVDNDQLAANAPIAFIRESNKINQIVSGLSPDVNRSGDGPKTVVNAIFNNVNIMKDLKDSLEFMKTVHALHAFPSQPVRVIESGDN